MSSLISRFFPVPRYLAMEAGGIEISDRSVKFMRFLGRGPRMHLAAIGEVLLPPGAISSGAIKDASAIVLTLKEARRRCGFALCSASLPESKGYLFTARLSRQLVPRKRTAAGDLHEALGLTLSTYVPLAPAEAVYDCEEIEEEGTVEELSVSAAAFPEELALAYSRVLAEAGFLPISFELEPQAAARTLGSTAEPAIIADLGEGKTILCVTTSGRARFTTSSEGSTSLDQALASRGLAPQAIAALKTDTGLSGKDASEEFAKIADRWGAEIRRLAAYWNAQVDKEQKGSLNERRGVKRAVLYGGNANIKGLPEYLTRVTGLAIERADISGHFPSRERALALPRDQVSRFVTVAGLAMRGL